MATQRAPGTGPLLTALLSVLTVGASLSPASADSIRLGDRGDEAAPERYDTITGARFTNGMKRVSVRAGMQEYWPPNHTDWRLWVQTRAGKGRPIADYVASMDLDGLRLTRYTRGGTRAHRIDCPGLRYDNSSMSAPGDGWVEMSVPRSCLLHTQQVRILFSDGLVDFVPDGPVRDDGHVRPQDYSRWIDRG